MAKRNDRCDQTYPSDLLTRPEKHSGDLIFGTLFDGQTDVPQRQSIELAAMQVNDNIGAGDWLEGRKVGIVHCTYETDLDLDDLDYPEAAEAALTYLVDVMGIQALLGPATSSQSEVVYPLAESADVVVVSPSATSVFLNNIDGAISTDADPGLFWRTAPPDNLQGYAIANDMDARGVTSVAIVHQSGSYGTGLADVAIQEFGQLGIEVERLVFGNASQLTDAIVDAARVDGVQEVLLISSEIADVVSFLNGAEGISEYTDAVDPLGVFLTDSGVDPILLEQTSGSLDGQIRGTRPRVPVGGEYEAFSVAYNVAFGEDPASQVFASFSYDAAMLALYGAAWAHYNESDVSGKNIARGFRQVSDESQEARGIRGTRYAEGVTPFKLGQPVNLAGASGELNFDEVTGETSNPIEVWVINADRDDFETVRVCEPDGQCDDI
jgi:ABC-type branched-subunit amino acid transport system substrate-binding protein